VYSSRGIVTVGLLYGVVVAWHGESLETGGARISTGAWLGYAILMVLLAVSAGLVVESIYANALFGGYGRRFRSSSPRAHRTQVLVELWSLLACAEKIAVSAIGAAFVAGSAMRAFRGFAAAGVGIAGSLHRLLDAIYFVTTTFATVGYGDIVPVTTPGKLLAVGIEISVFLLVVIGLFMVSVSVARVRTSATDAMSTDSGVFPPAIS